MLGSEVIFNELNCIEGYRGAIKDSMGSIERTSRGMENEILKYKNRIEALVGENNRLKGLMGQVMIETDSAEHM